MSEELAESGSGTEVIDTNSQETVDKADEVKQPTIEDIAKEMGWRNKEQLKDQTKFVDAATYIKRTAVIKDDYRREVTQLKRTVEGMAKTFENATQAQYKKGIEDAENRMLEAKQVYDFEAYERAQQEALFLKQQQAQQQQIVNNTPIEIQDFIERNPWFDKDKEMTADALDYKDKYLKANPNAAPNEILSYVEKKIKRDYPEKFETKQETKPATPSPVEGVRTGNVTTETWQKQEKLLDEFERKIMDSMCSQMHKGKPIITKKQYIEQLAATGRFGRG